MLRRRYTSLLITTSILVQSVAPALASYPHSVDSIEENLDVLKKFSSTPAPLDFESRAGKTAAGVLHWARKNGEVYVLLGKRNDSKDQNIGDWCNFGGGSDAADFIEGKGAAQGLMNTAEREVREESNGIYAHHPRLLRKQPFIALYAPEEKGGLLHYMYWQQVQYLEPEIFKGKVAEASENHNKEYTDFMWVKASQLHQAVESQNPLLEVDGKPIAIYRPLFSSLLTDAGKTFLSELAIHKTIRRFNKEVRPLVNRLYITPSEEKALPGEKISVHWNLPEIQGDSQESSAMAVSFGSNAFGQVDRERQLIGPDGQLISKTSVSFDPKREEDVFAEAVAAHGAAMVELKHKGHEKIAPQAEPSDKWNSNCEETLSRIHLRLVLGEEYKTPDAFAEEFNPHRAADLANIKAYFGKYNSAEYAQKKNEFKREIKLLDKDYEFFADVLEWEEENKQWPTFYHGASANINNLYKSFTYLRELFDLRSFDDIMALRGTDIYFKNDNNVWDMVNRTGAVENTETSRAMLFLNFVLLAGRETTKTTSSSVEYVLNNHSVKEQNVTERFQEAMALAGFTSPEYAYFQSIFEQYIEHKNPEVGNSVLIAISQNPMDLDDYSYPTRCGHYYNKGKGEKEIRSTRDILNGIQSEFERQKKEGVEPFDINSEDKKSLFPEGRLFLRPERVMDPNITRIKAFDRFPLTQEERQAHDRDMRQTTIAIMADWLAQKTTVMQGSFVNEPILKKLYRFAYRGVTQEDLKENPSADGFMRLVQSEHFEAVREYLENYPEVLDLLGPVQMWKIPQRSKDIVLSYILETSPKELLINDGYMFYIILEVLKNTNYLKSKSLNIDNVFISDENMLSIANFLRNNRMLTSLNLKSCSLHASKVNILADGLRENTTLEKLSLSQKALFTLMGILILDETSPFRRAPWFKALEAEYESYSPAEIIQDHLDNKRWGNITYYIKNATTEVLDFSTLQLPWNSENSWRDALVMGLKDNSTLKDLRLANKNQWVDLMTRLMSSPPGPFTNAPWFVKAKDEVFRNPGGFLQHASTVRNYDAILNLIKNAPEEIELGKHLPYAGDWFNILVEKLRQNDDYFQLNLSGASLGDESVAKLAAALRVNTKLRFLNLTIPYFYGHLVKALAEGLKDNRTLEKLSLSTDAMLGVIGLLVKDSEGGFREAPWFKRAWEDVMEHSDQHINRVVEERNDGLLPHLVANSKREVLDLTTFNRYDSSWIDPILTGLKANEVVRTLKISSNNFYEENSMKKLVELLQANKTLKHLELKGALGEDLRNLLIEALKSNTTLEDLVFSDRRAPLEVVNSLYPYMDTLSENIKNWVRKVMESLRSTPVQTLEFCAPSGSAKALDAVASFVLQNLTELKMDLYAVPSTVFKALENNKTVSVLELKFLGYSAPIADVANFLKTTGSIHTLRLHSDSFSSEDAKALSEALVENKVFKTLELRSYAFKNNSRVMPIFADTMRKTGFSKTLKVSENNELSLLNEVILDKENMQPHWAAWMESLWGRLSANPRASLVKAIQAGHKNIALALLEIGQVSELDISDIFLDEIATENLIELLKDDKRIQSFKMKDYGHKVLVKLLPFQGQLSNGAKAWVQSTWNSLMENPDESVGQALKQYDGNQEVASLILNSGGVKTLNLAGMNDYKVSKLFSLLGANSTLESLTLSGDECSPWHFSHSLVELKSNGLVLKNIDLSNLVFEEKFEESDVRNLRALLLSKNNLQMTLSKTVFEEKMLTDIQESPFVKSGQLIIKEE